jgi:hypothetical protein
MTHDRFDDLMRDAAETYRRPPDPPLDQMWSAIEREVRATRRGHDDNSGNGDGNRPSRWNSVTKWVPASRLMQIAATLVIGIAIGRMSLASRKPNTPETSPATVAALTIPNTDTALDVPYQVVTDRYLGQAAALLIALPSEVKAGRADEQFVARAGSLLGMTRLLLDSPAANDNSMRGLLEDLELVLAQVVRLQNDRGRASLDLINEALEQRDVIPRLRTAVGDISAND